MSALPWDAGIILAGPVVAWVTGLPLFWIGVTQSICLATLLQWRLRQPFINRQPNSHAISVFLMNVGFSASWTLLFVYAIVRTDLVWNVLATVGSWLVTAFFK